MMTQYWRKYDHATYFDHYIGVVTDIRMLAEMYDQKLYNDLRTAGDDYDEAEKAIRAYMVYTSAKQRGYRYIYRRAQVLLALGQVMNVAFNPSEDV